MSREALSFPAYMPFLLFSKEGIRVKLAFTKMHGCGNNYIYFNCFDQTVPDPESLSIKLSEPHFGIGGDGIILISPSDKADAQMRNFNADGSEGKMCGNGIRCVGKYLYDNGMTDGRTTITIDTLNFSLYRHLIAYETQAPVHSQDRQLYIRDSLIREYTFQKNWYFVAGDQVFNSRDSRYIGPIPEDFIVGKASFVLTSKDPHTKKYVWQRFFKKIK